MELIKRGKKIELLHPNGDWTLLKEEGFSPIQITVAAVAACSGYVYHTLLEKKRVPVEELTIEVDYEQDQDQPVHVLTKIDVHFTLKVAEEDQKKAESALKFVKEACPVAQSINPDVVIIESVTFK
ncbi:OsmC family protein [Listeria ilorinensis]|uniref:OsmC family protein n=1 Tax=Listeria ilorinensis TaxID=2867439 RepID=UPI001EF3F041|nr:OsmC family protein [Listeria ilorinensis]